MRYRRALVSGGTYFFTACLADRSQNLLTRHIDILRQTMRQVRADHPFDILAMVVLPDHLHCLWQLPEGDRDYPTRWALIKSGFSRQLPCAETISLSRHLKRERGIWQRRFWEHCINDEEDLQRHVDYIPYNPVKHGHAVRPSEWPFSSIHRAIRSGQVPADWAGQRGISSPHVGLRRQAPQPNLRHSVDLVGWASAAKPNTGHRPCNGALTASAADSTPIPRR